MKTGRAEKERESWMRKKEQALLLGIESCKLTLDPRPPLALHVVVPQRLRQLSGALCRVIAPWRVRQARPSFGSIAVSMWPNTQPNARAASFGAAFHANTGAEYFKQTIASLGRD